MLYLPGAPPLFRPQSMPLELHRMASPLHIHLQRIDNPRSWLPTFQAIELSQPGYTFNHVDLVVSAPIMIELLKFVQGEEPYRSLMLDVTMINDTLMISRHRRTFNFWYGHPSNGRFGPHLQYTLTRWPKGMEDSDHHQRLLEYKFGHLNLVIMCGVDACLEWPEEVPPHVSEDLRTTLSGVGSAKIVHRGFYSDLPAAEMKAVSKSTRNKDGLAESLIRQMWFNRAQYAILGHYDLMDAGERARVTSVTVTDISIPRLLWEQKHQLALQKLVALCSRLREIARKSGKGRLYLVRRQGSANGSLHVFRSDCELPLTEDEIPKFWS
ncbi:hypothetical protein F4809DRAFT_239502 [Biscogniauxia mediterranea]|nr:hypothetical protein F4809DRAFT_239502 [Biscogniauxia mediterranea]